LTKFGEDLSHQKVKKTPKKCPLYHFFDPQEVVLGESTFRGENGLQIRKFKLFQKVDRKGFPTSHLGPDLDEWKTYKMTSEVALHIKFLALHIK